MQTILLFTLDSEDATDAFKSVRVTSLSACPMSFYNPNAVGLHTRVVQKKAKKDRGIWGWKMEYHSDWLLKTSSFSATASKNSAALGVRRAILQIHQRPYTDQLKLKKEVNTVKSEHHLKLVHYCFASKKGERYTAKHRRNGSGTITCSHRRRTSKESITTHRKNILSITTSRNPKIT